MMYYTDWGAAGDLTAEDEAGAGPEADAEDSAEVPDVSAEDGDTAENDLKRNKS
jgi:hypothetical protein